MDWRALGRIGMAVALGSAIVPVRHAAAFTMGEQMATTGVANTLGSTGASSASSTIGSVKSKLSSSAPSAPKLGSIKQPTGRGAGSPIHKRTAKGNSGWGNSKSWARNAKGGGGSGKNGQGWTDAGGWPKADAWASQGGSKTWAKSGGGSWARPGNKS